MLASYLRGVLIGDILGEISKYTWIDNLLRAVGLPCPRASTVTFRLPEAHYPRMCAGPSSISQTISFHVGDWPGDLPEKLTEPSDDLEEDLHFRVDDLGFHLLFGIPGVSLPHGHPPASPGTRVLVVLTNAYMRACKCQELSGELSRGCLGGCLTDNRGDCPSDCPGYCPGTAEISSEEEYDGYLGDGGDCSYVFLQQICAAFAATQFGIYWLEDDYSCNSIGWDLGREIVFTRVSVIMLCRGLSGVEYYPRSRHIAELPWISEMRAYIRRKQDLELARWWLQCAFLPGVYRLMPAWKDPIICCRREFHEAIERDIARRSRGESVSFYYDEEETTERAESGDLDESAARKYLERLREARAACPRCCKM